MVLLAVTLLTAPGLAAAQPSEGEAPEALAEPPTSAPEDTVVRGLSWDVAFGGVPPSGSLGQVEIGFSGLPRFSYHYGLRRGLSVGGLVAFDYGYWSPSEALAANFVLAAPIRYTLLRNETVSIGVRAEPGLLIGVDPAHTIGLMAHVGGTVGFTVENRFIVGGGVDVPLLLGFPTDGERSVYLSAPILVGPVAEFHPTPPLAATFEVKLGPHLRTTGTELGMRILAGAAYRF